jgi:hypothetical protein
MAYTPVIFDPLPVGRYSDRTSVPVTQTGQAAILDANFSKLSNELASLPAHSSINVRTVSGSIIAGWTFDGNWHTFAAWAPLVTFQVPECSAVLATIGARVGRTAGGFWVAGTPWGSAFTTTQSNGDLRIFIGSPTGAATSSHLWIVGRDITIGGTITLTPQYMLPGAANSTALNYGELSMTALG